MHALRDAAALLDEPLDRDVRLRAPPRIQPGHGKHRLGVERLEAQRRVDAQPGRAVGVLGRRQHEQAQRVQPGGELVERGAHRVSRTLDVVEHQQRRPPCRLRARQRRQGRVRRAGTRGVQHGTAVAMHLAGQLSRQPRLADSARARDQHKPSGAAMRAPPQLAQPLQLRLAARHRRRGVELGRHTDGLGLRRRERGVLAQDCLVQPPQLRSRLGADRLDQRGPGLPVGLERVGLPPGAIQRQHPLRVQLLAQRLGDDEALELADHIAVAPGGQVELDRELERREAQLLEPADLRGSERLVGDVVERCTAPQLERLAWRAARDQPLESLRVDGIGRDPQLVPAPPRDDRGAALARGQRLAQLGHVYLHQLRRRRRRLLPPETLDQALARDRRARVEGEHRQQCPRLGTAEGDRPPVDGRLQRSQDLDVHLVSPYDDPTPRRATPASAALLPASTRRVTEALPTGRRLPLNSAPPRRPPCTPRSSSSRPAPAARAVRCVGHGNARRSGIRSSARCRCDSNPSRPTRSADW